MNPTATILQGDALEILRTLPAQSVHTCVTSPPYWALRDYGVAGQIGLEPTVPEFVARMVAVFREVHRVLRDDGTCWVNLGDTYNGTTKQLVGIPWRIAFALQDDGWYLRQDIIWHKPNPMPESVRDRCTKAHEYIFLLSKRPKYYFDAEAMKEPVSGNAHARGKGVNPKAWDNKPIGWARGDEPHTAAALNVIEHRKVNGPNSRMVRNRTPRDNMPKPSSHNVRPKQNESFSAAVSGLVEFRNKRSVWSVGSSPYKGAHFATFPPTLIRPCVLAGCPRWGVVLDPFAGSGTTGAVAMEHGRNAVLIELNPAYVPLIEERLAKVKPREDGK